MRADPTPAALPVLLVEDDRLFAATLRLGLEAAGLQVCLAPSAEDALNLLETVTVSLAIIDEGLPGCSGVEFAARLRERHGLPFIFLTACSNSGCVERAIGEGALAYLVKPVDVAQLLPMIFTAMARSAELADLRANRDQLQSALDQERDISVATGIVMARLDIEHRAAFDLLRRAARSSRRKLADVARELIVSRGSALQHETCAP